MSVGFHWRAHTKFQPYQLHQSVLKGWQLVSINTPPQKIQILSTTVITRFVIVLHFYLPKKQWQSIVIMNDALTEKAYRDLGVSLKISGAS
ncbi:MAG: hypothetical protein KAG26_02180 [Methylococcales bacterium]|nr:hypothetical protein [Methylococcales bacterium]